MKSVSFRNMEYKTSDRDNDPDYIPEKECEDCAESYEIIDELNETIFKQKKKIEKLKQELAKLKECILKFGEGIKAAVP